MSRGPKPAKSKEAKPPSARRSPKNDGARVRDLEKRLAEALKREAGALEQQTATSELLKVIGRSTFDLQPVFDALAENAVRLCEAERAFVYRFDGQLLRVVATHNVTPELRAFVEAYPNAPGRHGGSARAALERRTIHIVDAEADPEYVFLAHLETDPIRTVLAVPMLRADELLGVIFIYRHEVWPFTDSHISLMETFADQAVIAIENVRLFNETKEALEQQTATSEILRVISSSPTDIQPVFDAIARSAAVLCGSSTAAVFRLEGGVIDLVAHHSGTPEWLALVKKIFPAEAREQPVGWVALQRTPLHFADIENDTRATPEFRAAARALGFRRGLLVPMHREDTPLGAIGVGHAEPGAFSDRQIALLETFADQAVIAIENVRLFKELQEKNRALMESLEHQTATSEILRVISGSPTDVQPVFETIARSAAHLTGAVAATLYEYDGRLVHVRALEPPTFPKAEKFRELFPRALSAHFAAGHVILGRRVLHVADLLSDPATPPASREWAEWLEIRSVLWVPLLRDDEAIGVISVSRSEAGHFSDDQVKLLQTFADQAVIAIENVRLFNETKEALERQTATSEILRVISRSPTDAQPVFDEVAQSAARLCQAQFCHVFGFDGALLHVAAHHGLSPEGVAALRSVYPSPPGRGTVAGRSILSGHVEQIPDINADADYHHSQIAAFMGYQSIVAVPMLREGMPIGCIVAGRSNTGVLPERLVTLLQTFADQAVIAIENVRLFKELQARNRDLTDALDQQTATSELLKVIGRSTFDLQPVFATLAENAVRLCEAGFALILRFDGQMLRVVGTHHLSPETRAFAEQHPVALDEGTASGRAALQRGTVHIHDILSDPEYTFRSVDVSRTILAVPMLRAGELLGVITIYRREVRPFSDNQIVLMQTFADQAAIAIENARLLSELQARTEELTRSVGQLTALGEVGRAVSSTLDLETVLSTIVSRAIQLSGTDGGSVYEYDEATEEFSLRASRNLPEAYVEQVRYTRPRKAEGAVGRVAETREPVQIADISDPAAYESRVRNTLLQIGLRALLAVPLIAEDQLVGALIVMRKRSGTFAAEEVALLQTFATQSALAIQNARLFREIEEKSRQLEVASQHKSEFLANMSHELRTPLNAIIGFSEVLSERMFGELNEKQEEYLKDIYASGTHLLSLINDILDLSKIEAGRMELELTDFHLPTALDSALTLVRERAGRRGIALQMTVDSRVGQIQADERKIRQVVLNLLSNAIKFTPEGGRIEVAAVPKDGSVEVSVTDTGVGIASEDQEAVFEEFRQVGTADKKVEGTGLGLALCRKFVELHGGKIWVTSQVGAGSTFTFTIPVRRGE